MNDLIVELVGGTELQVRAELTTARAKAALNLPPKLRDHTRDLRRAMIYRSKARLGREVKAPDAVMPPDAEIQSPDLAKIGEQLFRAVFAEDVYGLYSVWRAGGAPQRLRLIVPADLAWVPWEMLRDPHRTHWLALTNGLCLVREAAAGAPPPPARVGQEGLSIFAAGTNPIDLPKLDIDREKEILEKATAGSGRLTWSNGDAGAVLSLLNDASVPYHIFHFAGHGSFDQKGGVLYWGDGPSQRITAEELGTLLANHPSLRLVVVNACEGATAGDDPEVPSIADALVRKGVPAVLAMQAPILDSTALDAAREFYGSLARGERVDDAVTSLRRALAMKKLDWVAPVLTVANAEALLFAREEAAPPVPRPKKPHDPSRWKQALGVSLLGGGALLVVVYFLIVPPGVPSGKTGDHDPTTTTTSSTTTTTSSATTTTSSTTSPTTTTTTTQTCTKFFNRTTGLSETKCR